MLILCVVFASSFVWIIRQNQSQALPTKNTEATDPLILNVTTNLYEGNPDWSILPNGLVNITATTNNADNCVLEYTVMCWNQTGSLSPINNGLTWTNETMTRNGDSFSGYINLNSYQYYVITGNYRIIANNLSGQSTETEIAQFGNMGNEP
jgi:hypothetical protein